MNIFLLIDIATILFKDFLIEKLKLVFDKTYLVVLVHGTSVQGSKRFLLPSDICVSGAALSPKKMIENRLLTLLVLRFCDGL